jgi:SAM-dependent methyltransferase
VQASDDKRRVRRGSPERFGYSWQRFSRLSPEQEQQFRRWTCLLDPDTDWKQKIFLDVGCGMGRNSYWAMTYGAAAGLAIDVDERSLDAARRNLADYPSVEVRFASIYELDKENAYDIAFSIGVIHHLEEPNAALQKMANAVRPGGQVLIWVYGYENMALYVNVLNPLRKAVFSRLPVNLVKMLAYVPAALLFALLRLNMFKLEYFKLLSGFSFRHVHHIVFDQMLPRVSNYWKRSEVLDLMTQAGLVDIEIEWVNQMSWTAMGSKPE